MPLFLSEEEFERCSNDASAIAEKADSFIRDLYKQLETVKAQADAASITAEQTCSLLEQKYLALSFDFGELQLRNSELGAASEHRVSELAQVQAEKHQIHLQSISKDGEIERLSMEASELHKSKRQLMELLEQKDLEISEKNANMKSYLDKIVNLTDTAASREARLSDIAAELTRTQASCARLSQEKELIERHNLWLNDELTSKVNSCIELRKTHNELEAEMSAKLTDVERQFNECSNSLKWNKEKVRDLELKLSSSQEELCSSKDAAASCQEQFYAELTTVNKLVELYKESSEEWSKKSVELEGVIKALETHLSQVESDYKERLEKAGREKQESEKEVMDLKEKLKKSECDLESLRKANEQNLVPLSTFSTEGWLDSFDTNGVAEDTRMLVPCIPQGVSGTALAASLLRDGWSLAKMYGKYQEAVDALRHEQLGRKQAQSVLERVLREIEEKAGIIFDERAEHERMVDAYSDLSQKMQNSLSEQSKLEKSNLELKAHLRRQEREYSLAQKEVADLQREVTVLLKECQDIQVRCGSADYSDSDLASTVVDKLDESDADKIISERLLTFVDIKGLVEQNVRLRSLVRSLSDQIENRDLEIKQKFELEIQRHTDDAASKVAAVLERSEEQGHMIESLHNSVAMYKRLYEEEHKLRSSDHITEKAPEGKSNLLLLLESSQEAKKKFEDQAAERLKCVEDELAKSRNEIMSLRSERDKFALEANFARERLDSFMKELEHQRGESNGVLARNVEFSQLIIDYQRKLRENLESLHAAEELSRKSTMEVSVLKNEKELLLNSEKRACDEVRSLLERVHRLQTSLDTIQATEEIREEARCVERKKQEDHVKQVEREWAEAKKELQQERDNIRSLTIDRDHTIKDAMRQVDGMGKELADALRAIAASEARAAVAEARFADLEKKMKSTNTKIVNLESEHISSFDDEAKELNVLRDELEKVKVEAQANKDHMLQYKNIAQVNEVALKQMECAHENFKNEAEELKTSLGKEVNSLRERVSELEEEFSLKSQHVASEASGKEASLSAALAEVTALKEERSVKMSQILAMEIKMSALKEDLEKEHQRWRTAHDNYERQVVLQSETIQELTKTSQALASLQTEASELRKSADAHKNEYNSLKSMWEGEKTMFEKARTEAETKYNDINEQNKILHTRLESLHIKLAEKDRGAAGISSESTSPDTPGDSGLQNVINYLRRSKEIAETEISLLKQEKLRLQSQLESALKAAEAARASLHAERTNSRAMLFTEEEIKSLQLQVREMNLMRESNMQLREENKHNFEECQKLLEAAHRTRADMEKLEMVLKDRDNEIEACRKEIELLRVEKSHLDKRIVELLDRSKHIDVEDYDQLKDAVQQMQINLTSKDGEIEQLKDAVAKKEATMAQLEQDLAKSRHELVERESRINDVLQLQANLRSDIEKQKKTISHQKKKLDTFSREKEELSKEIQSLSTQLGESKQDATGEQQASKEKEKEKDAKIKILEKHVERQREDLTKERKNRQKSQSAIEVVLKNVIQEKGKLDDELGKHKEALMKLSDEVERLKHAKVNLPEATSAVQHLSKSTLDDLFSSYGSAIENFEKVANSVFQITGVSSLPSDTPVVDCSIPAAPSGSTASVLAVSMPATSSPPGLSQVKPSEERVSRPSLGKPNFETRKTARKLIRPRLVKPEEPQNDVMIPDVEGSGSGKPGLHDTETQEHLNIMVHPPLRKRVASASVFELQDNTPVQGEASSDVSAPMLKKARGSDSPQETFGEQPNTSIEIHETSPVEESSDVADVSQFINEEIIDAEKDEAETMDVHAEGLNDAENMDAFDTEMGIQTIRDDVKFDKANETEAPIDDQSKDAVVQEIQPSALESSSEKEEGELAADVANLESEGDDVAGGTETSDDPQGHTGTPASPSGVDDEPSTSTAIGGGNASPNVNDIKNDDGDFTEENAEDLHRSGDRNDQVAGVAGETSDQVPEAPAGTSEPTSDVATVAAGGRGQPSSTTINITKRAEEQARLRRGGHPTIARRGGGRSLYGRNPRGGARGRGQSG